MLRIRAIPCLLVEGGALVKTTRFKDPAYIGDPMNAVRIFNELEVDEIIVLDIRASREGRGPDFKLVRELASQCFMPLGYGGGVSSTDDFRTLFKLGIEKVVVNTAMLKRPALVTEAAKLFGSQSVIASIDVKKNLFGKPKVHAPSGHDAAAFPSLDPADFARQAARLGAGEIFLNSVDRDGMMDGYDTDLIRTVTDAVDIPVIACGGAGETQDLRRAVERGAASAVAAGSLFVYQSRLRAVLIKFTDQAELGQLFKGL